MTEQEARIWFRSGRSRWHVLISMTEESFALAACTKLYWSVSRRVDLNLNQYPHYTCRHCLQTLDPAPTRLKIIRRERN